MIRHFIILIIILSTVVSCKLIAEIEADEVTIDATILHNDSIKYWDSKSPIVCSIAFSSDWMCYEYAIYKGKKYLSCVDIISDSCNNWSMSGDTVSIRCNTKKFKILEFTKDTLLLQTISLNDISYIDTVLFVSSEDQQSKIIMSEYALPSDSTMWKYNVIIRDSI